jgi:hypothetical protein
LKEANKKFIIFKDIESSGKTLKTIDTYTAIILIKMFRSSKKYPSRDTVPLSRELTNLFKAGKKKMKTS